MASAIVTCGCGDMNAFAQDAFKILFPRQAIPKLISHSPQNSEFAKWVPYVRAADKQKLKYAYYMTEEEFWDLKKGVRLA